MSSSAQQLVASHDILMESLQGHAGTVAAAKYVWFEQMLTWLKCVAKFINADEGQPHVCGCEVCVALESPVVDLTAGQSYTAGGGCSEGQYLLKKWHNLLIIRDLETAESDNKGTQKRMEMYQALLNVSSSKITREKRRNSV